MFAVEYPGACRGLVLLNSSSAIDEASHNDADARINRRSGEPWFPAAFAAMNRDDDIATDEEFKALLTAILPFYFHDVAKYDPAWFAHETYAADAYRMMSLNSEAFARGALDRLGELQMPAVIVTGDDDFICSSTQAMRIHVRLPGSKLVVIERAGHFPWLEQPETFYAELENALRYVGALAEVAV
jgi:proline iminopeptidase